MPNEDLYLIRTLVAEELELPAAFLELELDTNLVELGLDPVLQADLACDLEEVFQIEFDEDQCRAFCTLRSILTAVQTQLIAQSLAS